MDEEAAVATVNGVAQVFDLHALEAFAPDKRVRKMLVKSDQLWSEIACYEPGQSTVMHSHPKEEEAIHVLQGVANLSGDHARLLRECTLERMEAAGSGGTSELLSWILVLAFTRGPADALAYMPAVAWRCGTGMVTWNDVAA